MPKNCEQLAVRNSLKFFFLLNFVKMSKIPCSRFQFYGKDNFLPGNEVTMFTQNNLSPFNPSVNSRNIRKRCEICSKLLIKRSELSN